MMATQVVPVFCYKCGPFHVHASVTGGRGKARCPECGEKIDFAWAASAAARTTSIEDPTPYRVQ